MKTKQETFDAVWNGLKSQGFQRSVEKRADGTIIRCRYRDDEGRKCAVGCLIPDEDYDYVFETIGSVENLYKYKDDYEQLNRLCENHDREFLKKLQSAHDSYSVPTCMEKRFRTIAELNNLTIPEGE